MPKLHNFPYNHTVILIFPWDSMLSNIERKTKKTFFELLASIGIYLVSKLFMLFFDRLVDSAFHAHKLFENVAAKVAYCVHVQAIGIRSRERCGEKTTNFNSLNGMCINGFFNV
jgi:hypothetical protein